MRNIWITVSYEGTNYAGFQRQPTRMTVQQLLEDALEKLTQKKTIVYFVARTDAGVHAWGQECTFYTESKIPGDRFCYAINAMLPKDVRVLQSREMEEDFSVRRMNYGKTYGYILSERKEESPFLRRYCWSVGRLLNDNLMRAASEVLIGEHDFTSFRGNNSVPANPIRNLIDIQIIRDEHIVRIYVTGEGFLYHMVRNIAGALVDIGTGVMTKEQLMHILEVKDRKQLGMTAPAEGLALLHVYFNPVQKEDIHKTIKQAFGPWTK